MNVEQKYTAEYAEGIEYFYIFTWKVSIHREQKTMQPPQAACSTYINLNNLNR